MSYIIDKLRAKALLALAPVLLLGLLAFSASSASAAPCENNVLCSGGGAGPKIRDDADEPPAGGKFGADALAVNTESELRLLVPAIGAENSNPTGYAFFGLEVESNPVTSETECKTATGSVTFADIQHASPSAVYAGISPGGFGAWPISIRSDHCAENPGRVAISNVHLFFPALGAVASGTFVGSYEQPGENCAGGGIKLDVSQPEVTVSGLTTAVDNGAGGNAFICLVSSNNVLFPNVAPEWKELQGSIWKD